MPPVGLDIGHEEAATTYMLGVVKPEAVSSHPTLPGELIELTLTGLPNGPAAYVVSTEAGLASLGAVGQ